MTAARQAGAPAPASASAGTQLPQGAPAPTTAGSAPRRRARPTKRPPRLASLQLKRIDPWTVLKISLVVSIVMFFVWMIAVGILYLVLNGMGVWTQVNETYQTLSTSGASEGAALITPARVFIVAGVVGAINIVLFTLLATVAAFIYNAAAGMAGGVELTLSERD